MNFEFGGSGITEDLYQLIRANIQIGKPILEFGAGLVSTKILSEFYELYSVESELQWIGRFNSNYIYAPIKDGWYDREILREHLPLSYALILLDGPAGEGNRDGILKNLDLIRPDVPIIVDDTSREAERNLAIQLAAALNKQIFPHDTFAVLV